MNKKTDHIGLDVDDTGAQGRRDSQYRPGCRRATLTPISRGLSHEKYRAFRHVAHPYRGPPGCRRKTHQETAQGAAQIAKCQNERRGKLETIDSSQERQRTEQEIAVITLQRGKGVAVYRQLKAARKNRKEGKSPCKASLESDSGEPGKAP